MSVKVQKGFPGESLVCIPAALVLEPSVSHLAIRVYGVMYAYICTQGKLPSYQEIADTLRITMAESQKAASDLARTGVLERFKVDA